MQNPSEAKENTNEQTFGDTKKDGRKKSYGNTLYTAGKQADEREVPLWSSRKGWEAHAGRGWKIKKAHTRGGE